MARFENVDWSRIGQNARRMRIGQGISQVELAQRANVSAATIYNFERCAPISRRSLLKICEALNEPFDSLRTRHQSILTDELDYLLFRRESAAWIVFGETRTWVPEDDIARIQNPEERLRLGRLGFVPLFGHTTNFIMPEGPGMVNFELYSRYTGEINATVYRDCLIDCVSGAMRLQIRNSTLDLAPGDVVGFRSRDLTWLEPLDSLTAPTHFTWTGAIRIGSPVREVGNGGRVKRRFPKMPVSM